MDSVLVLLLILGPIVFAFLAYIAPGRIFRNIVVVLGALVIIAAGLLTAAGGFFTYSPSGWGHWGQWSAFALGVILHLVIIYIGIRLRSWAITVLGLMQLVLTLSEEYLRFQNPSLGSAPKFVLDPLSLILVLIVCIIGSLIVIYALGYMRHHEDHAPATSASTGRFFFFLIGFLGIMNGLVLSDTIQWLLVFWEGTTLCSFMLIAHDGTPEAWRSAKRALLICTFGGTANLAAAVIALAGYGVDSLSGVMAAGAMVPLALLCLGALTKSAQMPFQSWLLMAMVAPTPVSALLHSATMVKAGSYLVLRLAPAFAGTKVMVVMALAGAFTFAMTSALAIGQSNSKRVLAYSTIGNLGLIVACAGINTPLAFAAALMVLCFHAISKGLLFLCVGNIEQSIGSRDIEDMGGIRYRMPITTTITLVGMASMLIPPFGMLMSKWMAIEAALDAPLVLILLVAGSALTVVFWVKWMGRIQTVSFHADPPVEKISWPIHLALVILVGLVIVCGIAAVPIHKTFFDPLVTEIYQGRLARVAMAKALAQLHEVGEFSAWPVLLFLGLGFVAWLVTRSALKAQHVRLPFLCGENVEQEGLFYSFRGMKDEVDTAWAASIYMTSVFRESRITFWANLFSGIIVLSMFAVVVMG